MSSFTLLEKDLFTIYKVDESHHQENYLWSKNHAQFFTNDPLYDNTSMYEFPLSKPNRPCLASVYTLDEIYSNDTTLLARHHNQVNTTHTLPTDAAPYPIAVRYVASNGTIFVERFPFQITVDLFDSNRKAYIKREDNIKIWVPWTMTRIVPNSWDTQIYYSSHSLTDFSDPYFAGALPNAYDNGSICWGRSMAAHPSLTINSVTNQMEASVSEQFTTLFNEYFGGGWNTDLSPRLYYAVCHYLSLPASVRSRYPMIERFVAPDPEYITARFGHISAPRRRLLSSGFYSLSGSTLKQFAYTLYMLSDFTLEETLQFYAEIMEANSSSATSFEQIASANPYSSDPLQDYGTFNWNLLGRAPFVSNKLLSSSTTLRISPTIFVLTYNTNMNSHSIYYSALVNKMLLGSKLNTIFAEAIRSQRNSSSLQINAYLFDVDNNILQKIEVPTYEQFYSPSAAALHYCYSALCSQTSLSSSGDMHHG